METENKYKYSKAYFKILELIQNAPNETVFVIRGGQGASKTISVIELIIQSLLSSEKEATILSSELSKMKRTVIRDYKKVCKDWGVFKTEEDFNKSESKHEYPNGSYIDFLGADVIDVGKGFRRDILYINEADKMDIETAIQFISRAGLTIIDYNPDKLFWGDDFIKQNNFLTLTFEDNEFLKESELKSILEYKEKGFNNPNLPASILFEDSNIKNKYWANKWKVYGMGLVGSLDGVVFENWDIVPNVPYNAEFLCIGMDFGFTNDPSAAVKLFKLDNEIYVKQVLYESGLTNQDIAERLRRNGVTESMLIVADSAEPKSIAEIAALDFNIEGCEKGPDSVRAGIDLLQTYKIHVTEESDKVISELRGYVWKVDKNGKSLNEPIGINDHAMAALRYGARRKLSNSDQWSMYVS